MKHTRLMAYLLSDTFHRGVAYDCVNTARRAFSSLGIVVDVCRAGNHPLVNRFLRGVFNLRPPMLLHTDLGCQVGAGTAAYSGTVMHPYTKRTHIEISNADGIHASCPDCKRSYATDRRLCVCETLKVYIERTAQFRTGVDQMDGPLFLSIVRPHKPVTRDTIARWVRIMLHRSGVDTRMYSAGSVRQAAALRAKAMAVPIAHILAKAGWSSEATFARHYNKEVLGDIDTFQDGVLG
ncbi:hypothetical protein E2C01_064002 [Portunus trituberculatus]|uniref:Tyr recombinase domain-containing protein n=1 Tax=Portunus trituberculatus TaxID=210409 RepID=A0A5B7HAM0_PORTR|nr:hypothetical protein [Portunus trituberculatus]